MKKLVLILLLAVSIPACAQMRYDNKTFKFSMLEPQGWIWADSDDLDIHLDKLDLDEEALARIVDDHKGSVLLQSFFKYDPLSHPGIIPAIQINVRARNNPDFDVFKEQIVKSSRSLQRLYADYTFEQDVTETKISGVRSLYFISKFTMKTDNGSELKVRSRIYVIPMKDYYFQINMTDGVLSEDCSREFEKLIRSIKVKKREHNL